VSGHAHRRPTPPSVQWVTICDGALSLVTPPEPPPVERPPPPIAQVSIAPQAHLDRLSKFDPEHGIIKHNKKVKFDRDVNAEAFSDDRFDPAERANVGFAAFKNKYRR